MPLISPKEARIKAGLPALKRDLPAQDRELFAGFQQAKAAIVAILKQMDPSKIKITSANDLYKLSVSMASLIKGQIEFERWSAERHGYREETRAELMLELRNELGNEPDLVQKLCEVVEKVQAKRKAAENPESGGED